MSSLIQIVLKALRDTPSEFTVLKAFNGYLGLYGPGPVSWYLAATAFDATPKPRYEIFNPDAHPEFLRTIAEDCYRNGLTLYVKRTECLKEFKL